MKTLLKALLIMAICGSGAACGQKEAPKYVSVSPTEFVKDIQTDKTAYVLDVRTPQEYAEGHIANAHNLDWLNQKDFKINAPNLPKDSTIYVYCRSGKRSAEASQYLANLGYKVIDLTGGYLSLPSQITK